MKKHLLLTLVASIAFTGALVAEEAAKAAAAAPAAEAKAEVKAVAKNDAPGSLKAGNLLLDEGKFEEAAAYFAGIGEQSSTKREPYRLLGLSTSLVELGKYPEAIEAANKAVELKSDLSGAWNNLAAAQARDGKRDEAIATYGKAIAALKEKGADTSKLEANLTELQAKIEEGKPKKVKEAEAKAKAEAEKAAAKVEEAAKAAMPAEKK
jgi:tetratricopeptide (TPR) repeat protein